MTLLRTGDARTRQIVEAAYALLEADGLDALTIRAVLLRTGLSRRAVYERFLSKDDLMLAVFEYTIRLAVHQIDAMIGHLPDPLARLETIVRAIVLGRSALVPSIDPREGSRLGAAMSREHLRLAESRPEQLQAALDPLIGLIAAQLADGMTKGLIRAAPPERFAALIYNLVSTTVHKELIEALPDSDGLAHRAQLAKDLWDFCLAAVAA